MNGPLTSILLWVVNTLLVIVITLLGLLLKAHKERDDERIAELKAEIERIRKKVRVI
jgi:hypothetical protein